MFAVSDAWKSTYPTACAGVLALHEVVNPAQHADLESRKTTLEADLRAHWLGTDRTALAAHPVLQAYEAYYRGFKKTYHVQLQLESILFKGKSLPSGAALVEAMFMAEVKNMLLTAGHDLDTLQLPILLDVAQGTETYTLLRGSEQVLKPGDMFMRDQAGVISSILYGPDQRTQITPTTRNVLFTVYAPDGIDRQTVLGHLRNIHQNVLLISPQAQLEMLAVFEAC